jgi:hypothetical protein
MLNSVLWSKNILHKTKKLMYHALVQSILLYGTEIWTLNTQQANKLLATKMDFGEDPLENQGKKRSEMSPLERSWRCGRTF